MRPELMRLGKSIVMVWEDRVMAYFPGILVLVLERFEDIVTC